MRYEIYGTIRFWQWNITEQKRERCCASVSTPHKCAWTIYLRVHVNSKRCHHDLLAFRMGPVIITWLVNGKWYSWFPVPGFILRPLTNHIKKQLGKKLPAQILDSYCLLYTTDDFTRQVVLVNKPSLLVRQSVQFAWCDDRYAFTQIPQRTNCLGFKSSHHLICCLSWTSMTFLWFLIIYSLPCIQCTARLSAE